VKRSVIAQITIVAIYATIERAGIRTDEYKQLEQWVYEWRLK